MTRKANDARAMEGVRHDVEVDGVRLLTPTRPQWTRNALEADLLVQVAFSRRVSDAITQPILRVGRRRFAPSVVLRLYTDLEGRPWTHVVEVDAGDGRLDAATLATGRSWCEAHGAAFHVVDEGTIRTGHLGNARLLTPYVGQWPVSRDVEAIDRAVKRDGGATTVGAATAAILAFGVGLRDAENGVRQAVANWFFDCNLSHPYDPSSVIRPLEPSSHRDSRMDPFLALLPL